MPGYPLNIAPRVVAATRVAFQWPNRRPAQA
jgi:hypothetical protein